MPDTLELTNEVKQEPKVSVTITDQDCLVAIKVSAADAESLRSKFGDSVIVFVPAYPKPQMKNKVEASVVLKPDVKENVHQKAGRLANTPVFLSYIHSSIDELSKIRHYPGTDGCLTAILVLLYAFSGERYCSGPYLAKLSKTTRSTVALSDALTRLHKAGLLDKMSASTGNGGLPVESHKIPGGVSQLWYAIKPEILEELATLINEYK